MKKKKTAKGAKKAKVRDLATKKGAAAKGGATGSLVDVRNSLQTRTCWLVGPSDAVSQG